MLQLFSMLLIGFENIFSFQRLVFDSWSLQSISNPLAKAPETPSLRDRFRDFKATSSFSTPKHWYAGGSDGCSDGFFVMICFSGISRWILNRMFLRGLKKGHLKGCWSVTPLVSKVPQQREEANCQAQLRGDRVGLNGLFFFAGGGPQTKNP